MGTTTLSSPRLASRASLLPFERDYGGLRARRLRVDAETIALGATILRCDEIDHIRYGALCFEHAGGLFRGGNTYEVAVRDRGGKTLRLTFADGLFGGGREAEYEQALDVLWEAITARLVDRMWDAIENDRPVVVGNVTLRADGAWVKPRWPFSSPRLVPWERLGWMIENGQLLIGMGGDAPLASLDLQSEWDAIVLFHALEQRCPMPKRVAQEAHA